ncbi:uncharacterized protein MELLADRAFT_123577 [Melampsora larici-populina 98AG31]|uniref:Secreted protein n=1 Tax=Melampsora larici-populina (strain 98AG31 / pathotype 3-4-7) TaxID=747676 RepID=F4RBD1_MELLP|nr:uncharacterized protein MELLADRAFT_123577 [Melampsora larici-populina 98AG31]EGG10063.1 secreted protein [Melampsora larici-populina 98AG31]
MSYVFPKVYLLLLSLWIHSLVVRALSCQVGFERISEWYANCKVKGEIWPQIITWRCPSSECILNGRRWVPMKNCQLVRSNDKGVSNQQGVKYEWNPDKKILVICHNSGGKSYKCPYYPSNVPAMFCPDDGLCTEPDWQGGP